MDGKIFGPSAKAAMLDGTGAQARNERREEGKSQNKRRRQGAAAASAATDMEED